MKKRLVIVSKLRVGTQPRKLARPSLHVLELSSTTSKPETHLAEPLLDCHFKVDTYLTTLLTLHPEPLNLLRSRTARTAHGGNLCYKKSMTPYASGQSLAHYLPISALSQSDTS